MNSWTKKEKQRGDSRLPQDEEHYLQAAHKGTLKILGTGCKKCQKLEEVVKRAVLDLGMNFSIEHVTDFSQIAAYGVISTPALVFNEEVVSFGKVLSVEDVKHILSVKIKETGVE